MPKRNDSSSPKSAQEPNLIVQHNLSADNLEHAHKLGGLAAPSIAVVNKDHGMNNFGEISLLAHHSLIDPKHVPVFDADVYSPRNPRPRYRVNEKSLKQFKAWLKPFADQTGAEHGLYNVADKVNERGHQEVLNDHDASNAMKLAWLHENGVQVPPVYRDVPATHPFAKMPAMQEFLAQHGVDHNARPGDKYYRDLSAAASKAIDQHGDQADDPEDAQHLKELHRDSVMDDDGQLYFGKVDRIFHDASAAGKQEVDQYAMHDAIGDKVKELGEDKFHAWAKPKLQPLEGEPYLPKGQRKMRYDLDAVLKEVTRKVRDAEGFNYGLGSARSNGAKKYRDIAGVQKDRHKIVSAEEFDAKKKVQDDEFGKLADKLAPYHSTNGGFGMMDALVGAIGDSYKRGKWLGSTLRENAFSGVPPHLQQELGDFANRLRQMPTQYFEAKPQRIVGLNEFKAAVVPHTTSPHILDLLRRNGINHVEKYQRRGTDADAIERAKATERVARAHDLLLSEPELVFDDLAKAEDEPGVALVTAYNDQGELLIGHRRDNGKWTLPGGHLNPGEDPRDGAERELYEETGLRPTSLSFFKEHTTDGGVKLYCFSAYVHGTPHSDFDPDEEVDEWKFVDVSDGLPSRFYNNMHGPEPESGDNIVANVFDIKKSERDESDLEKAERSLPADIGHSSVDESGVHFETGHPVSVKYVRGTTPAPNFGERFQQHIEPAGRYMVHSPDPRDPPKGWEKGEVHFKNPLVLHFNTSGQISYDEGSWKSRLHRALGATGPRLSRKIAALGHDGIVTTSDSGTHEIVDLTHLKKSEEDIEQPRWDNLTPDEAAEHAHGEGLAFEYSNPHSFTWRYDPKYPVANLSHIYHGTAKRWLSKERAGRLEEDPTDTYIDDLAHSMKSMPLGVAPIVVAHPSGNKPDLGDGYHRLAIAETSGITHTPAVVGTPKFDGIKKSEDEVGRLLDHPDPTERRMALRLSTTKAQHVIHAALDPDPSVHEAAIGHPLFGDVEGLYLTDAKEGHDGRYPAQQQLAFLARAARVKPFHISSVLRNAYSVSADAKNQILPAIIGHANLSPANVRMLYRGYGTTHEHRMAILDHPAVPIDVLEHALHGAMFCPGPQTEELAGKAAEHKNLSPEAREALVRQVGDASPPHVLEVAQRALAHGSVSRSLVDDLFARQMVGTPSANALIGALLRGPSATPEDIDRALHARPHPAVWLGALASSVLEPQHMDQLVAQASAAGDRDALKRMMDHPHFGARHLQVLVDVPPANDLTKAEGPHDPGEPHQMDPIVAEAWISRMRHAHRTAPWVAGQPRWGTLHNSLVAGDPEAFAYVREKLDPVQRSAREGKLAQQRREERQRAKYESQAVELGDHIHKPDHQVQKIAGGKDVWLYHGTTSKHLPAILKDGLHSGINKIKIDPNETPGVYLTARAAGGPATAQTYAQRAASHFGGDPVVLRVKHPYDDLQPDEDDADLSSGRHQFKVDHVPPHNIMEVDGERVRSGLSKAERNLTRSSLEPLVRHPVVAAMHGFTPSFKTSFRAARLLAGGAEVPLAAMRRALYVEDGNTEAAALRAYGFEPSKQNLKALKAVQQMGDFEKSESVVPNAQEIVAPHPEGQDVADAVRRAYANQFVFRVSFGGKHSKGSMLAHDEQADTTWFLKSGSGGAGVAAGADEDPSDPNAREAAWYHIAEAWGVADSYPRAELVTIDGQSYAAMKLLPLSYRSLESQREKDPGAARRILRPYLANGMLHQWAILDYALGDGDSHGENILSEVNETNLERRVHTQEPSNVIIRDEEVRLIDHGSAFSGPSFDPAHDQASFVPFYMRAWAPHVNFNALPAEEKLKYLPRVDAATAERLKTWLDGLSEDRARVICESYRINPKPSLDRLARLRSLAQTLAADDATNRLWATT